MKKNEIISIFQDGKICRGIPATILAIRADSIQVSFENTFGGGDGEEVIVWCRKRNKKGKYEAIGWNYWILPDYS